MKHREASFKQCKEIKTYTDIELQGASKSLLTPEEGEGGERPVKSQKSREKFRGMQGNKKYGNQLSITPKHLKT